MAVGTYQGVAGLAPRLFALEEETGSHYMVMYIAPACSSACTTGAHLCICRPIGGHLSSSSARARKHLSLLPLSGDDVGYPALFMLFMLFIYYVYAVYAISSLDTG